MTKFLSVPNSEEFFKFVELYEKTYRSLDRTYVKALQDFENTKLSNFSSSEVEFILRPYLLKWGGEWDEF
jgi:hypothetical protein